MLRLRCCEEAPVRCPRLQSLSCRSIFRRRWRRPFRGVRAGGRCGAEVHLLEVVSPRGASLLGDARAKDVHARLVSTGHAIQAAERAVHVRTVAYRGDCDHLPSYAQLVKARLLVIGQHYGTPRWRRNTRIVGTLSRAAPAPVLGLPPGCRRRPQRVHSVTLCRPSILR